MVLRNLSLMGRCIVFTSAFLVFPGAVMAVSIDSRIQVDVFDLLLDNSSPFSGTPTESATSTLTIGGVGSTETYDGTGTPLITQAGTLTDYNDGVMMDIQASGQFDATSGQAESLMGGEFYMDITNSSGSDLKVIL